MKKHFFIFLLSLCTKLISGQSVQNYLVSELLTQKGYDELKRKFDSVRYDFTLAETYAKAYLGKGITKNDTIKQADAYYFLSLIHKPLISKHYADSIILLTKTIDHNIYPAKGFLAKSTALRRMGNYREAFNQLLKAAEYARSHDNILQQLEVKYLIGIIRTGIGDDYKALDNLKKCLYEFDMEYKEGKTYMHNYIELLFALGDAYNRNGYRDSAIEIHKKGFKLAVKNRSEIMPEHFTLAMGITTYLENNHKTANLDSLQKALDSLQKAVNVLKITNDTENVMRCYLYMGKIYRHKGEKNNTILYYKKVDSISKETSAIFPFMRLIYGYRIEKLTYAEARRIKKLHSYIEFQRKDFEDLKSEIVNKYDIPETAFQKGKIIAEGKENKKNLITRIIWLLVITFFIGGIAYYHYRRQRIYRGRFEALLSGEKLQKKQSSIKARTGTIADLDISKKALNNITEKLKIFIEEKRFLSNDLSLNNLAKSIGTNSNYLSRVINFHEQKSFSVYITELRINYAIEELKINAILRKYSIKAIAEEVGYNNTQSFSRAFYKRAGIHPSYFIKKLEKELLKKRSA